MPLTMYSDYFGLTDTYIQFLLRWTSNAFYVYLRNIAGLAHKERTLQSRNWWTCQTLFNAHTNFNSSHSLRLF